MRCFQHYANVSSVNLQGMRACLLSSDIDLVMSSDLASIVMEQPGSNVFIKFLDFFVPIITIQGFGHGLSLLRVECSVARQHEVQASLTHEGSGSISPGDIELLRPLEDILGSNVGS